MKLMAVHVLRVTRQHYDYLHGDSAGADIVSPAAQKAMLLDLVRSVEDVGLRISEP